MLRGTKVEDPYRWLEADVRTSPEVADWVAEQNRVTSGYLKGIPERETIKRRLTELWNYESKGLAVSAYELSEFVEKQERFIQEVPKWTVVRPKRR